MFASGLGPIFLNNKLLFSGYRYEDNSDGYTREDIELFGYDPQNITFGNVIKFTFDFKLQVLPSSPDSDGDGVRDDVDLDDDNDGILDVDEGSLVCSEPESDDYFLDTCLLYTSPSPRDLSTSRMPSSA